MQICLSQFCMLQICNCNVKHEKFNAHLKMATNKILWLKIAKRNLQVSMVSVALKKVTKFKICNNGSCKFASDKFAHCKYASNKFAHCKFASRNFVVANIQSQISNLKNCKRIWKCQQILSYDLNDWRFFLKMSNNYYLMTKMSNVKWTNVILWLRKWLANVDKFCLMTKMYNVKWTNVILWRKSNI